MRKKKQLFFLTLGSLGTALLALWFGRWLGSALLHRRELQQVEEEQVVEPIRDLKEEEWPTIGDIEEEPSSDQAESKPEILPAREMAKLPETAEEAEAPLVEVEVRRRKTGPLKTGLSPVPPTSPQPPQKPVKEKEAEKPPTRYTVQVGTYRSEENAKAFSQELQDLGYAPRIRAVTKEGGTLYYVYLGSFEDRSQAQALRDELKRLEYEAFVTEQP